MVISRFLNLESHFFQRVACVPWSVRSNSLKLGGVAAAIFTRCSVNSVFPRLDFDCLDSCVDPRRQCNVYTGV